MCNQRNQLLFRLLLVQLIALNMLVFGLDIEVINDPTSKPGGRHSLTLKMQLTKTFLEPIEILLFLGDSNLDCNYYLSAVLSSGEVISCDIINKQIKLSTDTTVLTDVELKFKEVEYSLTMAPKMITVVITSSSEKVTDNGINLNDWVPQSLADFIEFVMIPVTSILTCQPFELSISGTSSVKISSGSKIELTFDSELDLSGCSSPELLNVQPSSRRVFGLTSADYTSIDYFTFTFQGIKGPSTAKNLTITLTVSSDLYEVYKVSRRFLVSPEVASYSSTIKLLSNKKICEKGTYAVDVQARCGIIPNGTYEIIPPFSTFGDKYILIPSKEDLDTVANLEFELMNPCSAITGSAVNKEDFFITVYNGNTDEIAFIYKAGLATDTSYEPGLLRNFNVKPELLEGSSSSYIFSMRNTHSIPNSGSIVLTSESGEGLSAELIASINGVSASLSYTLGQLIISVPMYISAMTDIEIKLGNFKNPAANTVTFIAYSLNADGFKIDESDHLTLSFEEPDIATVIHSMSTTRNLENAQYFFSFTSSTTQISDTDILGIKVPAVIDSSTCSMDYNEATAFEDEDFDFWISAKDILVGDPATALSIELNCRNPSITALTSNFEMVLFNSNGKKLLKGGIRVQTKEGAYVDKQKSYIECDKTCPMCETECSLVFERKNNFKFKTILITNERLNLDKLTCAFDESGQSFLSSCTGSGEGSQSTLKITICVLRDVATVTIIGINLKYPEYSDGEGYPMSIRTYATDDIDPEALIDEDDAVILHGSCKFPCKTCSIAYDQCDSCTDELIKGQPYYLYPNGTQNCGFTLITNCRGLENELCCVGYYKNEGTHQCLQCSTECKTCEGAADYCTSCTDPLKFLYEGECKEGCGEGTFEDGSICQPCAEGCETCSSIAVCSKCYNKYYLYEKEKTCVEECPDNSYLDGTDCKMCDSNCGTCYTSSTTCTRCKSDVNERYLLNNKCVDKATCENKGYIADSKLNFCGECSSECAECRESITYCSKCKKDMFLNETEGKCVKTCVPYAYDKPGIDGEGGTCSPCPNSCETCSSASECITCAGNMLFNAVTKECQTACTEGYYGIDKKCYPCISFCSSCDNSNTCLECSTGYLLYESQCYQGNCPSGTFDLNGVCEDCDSACSTCQSTKTSCIECAPGYYKSNNICVTECPTGTTLIKFICETCSSSCITCNGTVDSCTSCKDDMYLYGSQCLKACPTASTVDIISPKVCVDCIAGCKECTWDNLDDMYPKLCVTCLPGYSYLKSNCYAICPDGYVASSDGSLCVDVPTTFTELRNSKTNYVIFPHIIIVVFLSAFLIKLAGSKQISLNSTLIVVLNYVAISTYAITICTAFSSYKTEITIVTGVVLIIQIILNFLFIIMYQKFVTSDPEFIAWSNLHRRVELLIYTLSTIFSFQTVRLLYSRFMDLDAFFIRFKNFNNFFKLLNWYSLFQIITVQGVIIVFDVYELARIPYGVMNYTFFIESFVLSFLLVLALYYEMKNTVILIVEIKQAINLEILNNQSGSNQSINGASAVDEKLMATKQIIHSNREFCSEEKKYRSFDLDSSKKPLPSGRSNRNYGLIMNVDDGKNGYQCCSFEYSKEEPLNFKKENKNSPVDTYLKVVTPEANEGIGIVGVAQQVPRLNGTESAHRNEIQSSFESMFDITMNRLRENNNENSMLPEGIANEVRDVWNKISMSTERKPEDQVDFDVMDGEKPATSIKEEKNAKERENLASEGEIDGIDQDVSEHEVGNEVNDNASIPARPVNRKNQLQ